MLRKQKTFLFSGDRDDSEKIALSVLVFALPFFPQAVTNPEVSAVSFVRLRVFALLLDRSNEFGNFCGIAGTIRSLTIMGQDFEVAVDTGRSVTIRKRDTSLCLSRSSEVS